MPFLETVRAENGGFACLQWHQRRLDRTLAVHGIAAGYDLKTLLHAPEAGVWRCRVLYDADRFEVEYFPYHPRRVDRLMPVVHDAIDYRYKHADRSLLAALFDRRGAADDVLIVKGGLVTDTSVANTAFFDGTRWLTPERPLLEGTCRARLIAEGFLHPARITLQAALAAEKVAVMNALSGFVEVSGGILVPYEPKGGPC